MGFIDAIKRWRLVQKGMSSGSRRRKHTESAVAGAANRSPYLRAGIYSSFVVLMIGLVLNSSGESPFDKDKITLSLFALLFSLVGIYMFEMTRKVRPSTKEVVLVFGGLLLHMIFIQAISWIPIEKGGFDEKFMLLVMPYCFAPMIHSVLMGSRLGIFSTVMCSFFGVLMVPEGVVLYYFVISLLVGLVVVMLTQNVRRRGSLLRAGLYAGTAVLVMGICFAYVNFSNITFTSIDPWKDLGIQFLSSVSTSILIAMIISGVLPMLETTFSLTTNISWLELSDLNHKLLKRLQLEAPGTFSHSLSVAALSESAAEAVGANALMCRVCSYFHDIGKLKKPDYFIENQGEINPHDSITPTMSALVIIAHVKDGVDMAIKHKLNPKIVKVIQEHHGDSLVYYFYRKAQERLGEGKKLCDQKLENPEDYGDVDEKNFRYPGPTPSSKESGIISLAYAVESASRSLRKPTPAKISALVDDIASVARLHGIFARVRGTHGVNCDPSHACSA